MRGVTRCEARMGIVDLTVTKDLSGPPDARLVVEMTFRQDGTVIAREAYPTRAKAQRAFTRTARVSRGLDWRCTSAS